MLATLDSARQFTGEQYFNIVMELEKEKHEPDSSKWIYRGVKRNDLSSDKSWGTSQYKLQPFEMIYMICGL